MENKFYIYIYSDQNDVPFYVGKGRNRRFYVSNHLSNENLFLKNKIRKVGVNSVKVSFLHKNLTEAEAFQLEISCIEHYGRRDLGEGTLCNLTNGGEGNSGCIPSKETRQKISEANKGKKRSKETRQKLSKAKLGIKNPMYGKRFSEKTKKKMSENMKGNQYAKGFIHSEETRQRMSKAQKGEKHHMYGKHHSEETKKKLSEINKGNQYAKGFIHSEETRKKMSDARKLYLAKNPPKPMLQKNLTISSSQSS